jgi:hypothetical protein
MENVNGNRALIAAIISKAIEDGRLVRYPKHPMLANKAHKINNEKIKIMYELICSIHRLRKMYVYHKLYILSALLKTYKKLNKKRRDQYKEHHAYESRSFLSDKNKIFCLYCTLIDIDPEYFAIKMNKYFSSYDKRIII